MTAELIGKIAALVAVHLGMIIGFEVPDIDSDRQAAKTVLAVRIGALRATRLAGSLLTLGPIAAIGVAVATGALDADALLTALATVVPGAVTWWALRGNRHQIATASAVATLGVLSIGLLLVSG